MDNPKLIAATENMIRVVIRRPHAYRFRRDHPSAAIPSLVVMDAKGKMLGGTGLRAGDPIQTIRDLIEAHAGKSTKKTKRTGKKS